jgi:hypothetical protein
MGGYVMGHGKHIWASALGLSLLVAGSANAQLTVNGEVTTAQTLSDSSLGGTTVTATIGAVQYSGSSVYSLISDAGFEANPAQAKNGDLLDYLTITGASGQSVVLSEGQIDPNFGGQSSNPQDFIATTETIGGVTSKIAPELIVQSDPNGLIDGYDVTDVTDIAVDWASVASFSTSVLDDETSFTVTGDVSNSGVTYDTSNFSSIFPPTTQITQTDTYNTSTTKTFTGPSIFDVLQNAGLITDSSNPDSILDDYIVVTGSNEPTSMAPFDYAVVYSLGEIDPAFNDFASNDATEPLIAEVSADSFRSTAPSDDLGGRYDSDVINIQVVDSVPEPGSLALMFPPVLLLFSLRCYRSVTRTRRLASAQIPYHRGSGCPGC